MWVDIKIYKICIVKLFQKIVEILLKNIYEKKKYIKKDSKNFSIFFLRKIFRFCFDRTPK